MWVGGCKQKEFKIGKVRVERQPQLDKSWIAETSRSISSSVLK